MTARGAALLLACCISLAWVIPPRRAMAQNTSAVAVGARQSESVVAGGIGGSRSSGDTLLAPLERRVSLALTDATIRAALQEIVSQSRINLSYSARVVPVNRRVSAHLTNVTVRAALETVLAGTGIEVREDGGRIILARRREAKTSDAREVNADTIRHGAVAVRVVDTVGSRPIEGAVIGVRGTKLTATTNDQGVVLLRDVPSGLRIVTVRFLGYAPAEKLVVVPDRGWVQVGFALAMGMTRLQDMVTTATGQRRRYEVANDITTIRVDSVMATAPISSVTDLLEGRVPGLTVQRTSGIPGAPSRLRLRGVHSVRENNDPIVVVDGARIYASQSDARSGNLASSPTDIEANGTVTSGFSAPSPLDQLDPNSIETIEVIKGPSAATLYGADAANGVIVITTKRGRPGPARWTMTASRGFTTLPGRYPEGFYRLGHFPGGSTGLCSAEGFSCTVDSIVRFQALNDPSLTVLDRGSKTDLSLGVSGGASAITYSFTGSYSDETGLLRLPDFEADRFRQIHGNAPPDWMQRPDRNRVWTGRGALTANIGAGAQASITTMLTRGKQQTSPLQNQLRSLMATYVDRPNRHYYRAEGWYLGGGPGPIPDFYRRVTDEATASTNSASIQWQPRSWLGLNANAGLNVINRQDATLLPQGMVTDRDSSGTLSSARGSSVVTTLSLRATTATPLPLGFHLQLTMGADYSKTSTADMGAMVRGLVDGTSSLNGAGEIASLRDALIDKESFGWSVEPLFDIGHFYFSTGLRFDGGSTYGSHVKLPPFPKLGASWAISEESWFPRKGVFTSLRLRGAYGHAGRQPEVADRLRLYQQVSHWLDGGFADGTSISTFGNTQLRPERSTELDVGFDADLFEDRFSVTFSSIRQVTRDALLQVPLAPSVYGGGTVLKNIGTIRNTGVELSLSTQLVRSDLVTWSTSLQMTQKRSMVVSLGPGVLPFNVSNEGRVAPGYPPFGRWARPILGYADVNENGVIEVSEVQLGDSLVFMGATDPEYEASLGTTLGFFRGRVSVSAGLTYQDGLTQVNQTVKQNALVFNDPNAPFGTQAALAVMRQTDYGIMQTVNTLRLNFLSLSFNAPTTLAQRFGARSLSLAVQGSNLALRTNYAGKDPNVNAYGTGNGVADTGQLPLPRKWQFTIRAGY